VFAGNVGSIAACLWAHAILIVGRYNYVRMEGSAAK
jgi:hypothetical protein